MVLRDANYIVHNYDSDYDSILFNVNRVELFYFRVIHYIKHFNTKHCDSCNYTVYNYCNYGFYYYNHTYNNSVDSIDGDHHTNDSKYNNLYEFSWYTDHNDINKYKYGHNVNTNDPVDDFYGVN